jgi:phosphoribosyl 1,2-cyclic phosphodiesterase
MDGGVEATDTAVEPTFQLRVLASGSNGNCIFFRAGELRLLFDAGVPRRRIQKALWEIDEDLDAIDAMLVTHEHGDHIHALPSIMAKYPEMAIHCTQGTASRVQKPRNAFGADFVEPGECFNIDRAVITPFSTSHDAAQSVGYRVDVDNFSFAYVTDLGWSTREVEWTLQGVQTLVLEANYDERMLWNGRYPARLKRRVSSRRGHLSNEQTARVLTEIAGPQLQQVILGHLSASNNDPALAVDTVAPALDGLDHVHLMAADRTTPGELLTFTARPAPPPPRPLAKQGFLFRGEERKDSGRRRSGRGRREQAEPEPERQLSLF